MAEELHRDEFQAAIEQLRRELHDGFADLGDRLDRMNGRVRTCEQTVAVLDDRSNHALQLGTAFGGGLGGLISLLFEWIWHRGKG